jgi:uncharacterized protein
MAALQPLSEAELERLSAMLADERLPQALPLDAAQGACYALASGPGEFPAPDDVVALVVGEHAAWRDEAERVASAALIARFAQQCQREMHEAEDSLPLILFEDEHGEVDYASWCRGYLEGVTASAPAWDAGDDADAVDELLIPVVVLAQTPGEEDDAAAGAAASPDADAEEYLRAARDDLVDTLIDIRHHFFEQRTPRVPARAAPKVGRNDPCPCGSGRKFKQCHGQVP